MPETVNVPDGATWATHYKLRMVDTGDETEWIKSKATCERIKGNLVKGGYRGGIEVRERTKLTFPSRRIG